MNLVKFTGAETDQPVWLNPKQVVLVGISQVNHAQCAILLRQTGGTPYLAVKESPEQVVALLTGKAAWQPAPTAYSPLSPEYRESTD